MKLEGKNKVNIYCQAPELSQLNNYWKEKILCGKLYCFLILQKSNLAKLIQQVNTGFKFRLQKHATTEAKFITVILLIHSIRYKKINFSSISFLVGLRSLLKWDTLFLEEKLSIAFTVKHLP